MVYAFFAISCQWISGNWIHFILFIVNSQCCKLKSYALSVDHNFCSTNSNLYDAANLCVITNIFQKFCRWIPPIIKLCHFHTCQYSKNEKLLDQCSLSLQFMLRLCLQSCDVWLCVYLDLCSSFLHNGHYYISPSRVSVNIY